MDFNRHVKNDTLVLVLPTDTINANELISFLQSNTHITKLFFRNDKIDDEGAKALAKLPNLTSLDLRYNKIGDEGAKALAQSKTLIKLNLGHNKISDEGAKALAQSKTLIKLNLGHNKISDEGAKALAQSKTLINLNLGHNKISDEGAKALAQSKTLTDLILIQNNIGVEGIEALAKLQHCEVVLCGGEEIFYNFLSGVYSNKYTMNEESLKKVVFEVAQLGYNEDTIQSILTHHDKYRFLINSKDEQGHTLSHFYTNSPEMQKFLFEHGMIPEQERNQRREDERIARDSQSVHASPIVKRINFFTKKLVESVKVDKEQLKQAAASYVENIPELLEQYHNDPIRLRLLSLTDNEKGSVMKKTLRETDPIPGDEEFIKTVIDKAEQALKQQYLKKNFRGEYDQGYPTQELQYDYTRDDAKITIPESIGYIKLLIDNFSVPLKEKKELLVTLMKQNPDLVKNKLSKVKEKLGNSVILDKEQFNKTELHGLLNGIDDGKKVDELFKEISDLDIEKIWREQKEFVLLKQIYIAATTYGENSSACIQGTWTQIISSIEEISSEIVAQYDRYLEEEQKRETQKDVITKENIKPFLEV